MSSTSPSHAASPWRNTILAALGSYLDAGSIVAGSAGLALWAGHYHLSSGAVGLIAAFSSNAISAGVGSLVGGWLCDRVGRGRVFKWDLLFYAFGALWIIFATQTWMLICGYVLIGLAVGVDVPASWTLIAETAPSATRGRHGGAAQLLWSMGPVVVLVLAFSLSGLGLLGIRIVFAHLFVVSLVVWVLRRRQAHESEMWQQAAAAARLTLGGVRELFRREYMATMLLLCGMYGIWNLKAGTSGFFLPYILRTVGAETQAESVAFQAGVFIVGSISTLLIFMRYVDRANHRHMFIVSAVLQVAAMLLLALFPLGAGVALGYVVLSGIGGGFGVQPFFQLWSAESFPTALRSTALGLMFAIARIALGIWSLFVPTLTTHAGFHTLAWILASFLVVSGALGLAIAPSRVGALPRPRLGSARRRASGRAAVQRATYARDPLPP